MLFHALPSTSPLNDVRYAGHRLGLAMDADLEALPSTLPLAVDEATAIAAAQAGTACVIVNTTSAGGSAQDG